MHRFRRSIVARTGLAAFAAAAFAVVTGCDSTSDTLEFDDLTADEAAYVTRFVVLERARAVTFSDREAGQALLDSLASAWGDSALPDALALLPDDPVRLAALNDILERILEAEEGSLLGNPSASRLDDPMPEPSPEEPPVADDAD